MAGELYFGRQGVQYIGPESFPGNFNARKIWESTRLVVELGHLGCLRSGLLGLGIGSGIEPIQFFLTLHGVQSIGTDLYGFGWPSAPLDMLWKPWEFATYPYNQELHRAMQMDGLKLLMPDDSVDFIYSVSSVEHFGGFQNLIVHIGEARRVLKPGGALVFSTELSLTGEGVPGWCFSESELQSAVRGSGLALVSDATPLDPRLTSDPAILQLPEWTVAQDDWGKLSIGHDSLVYTSVLLSFQKVGEEAPASSGIPWPKE